ncbi:MAG: hypothetical protein Q8L89_03405 [Gammaproteobacteria bacterium]|nr:hypothetical protein [Gammaproteobacteria bacterium]
MKVKDKNAQERYLKKLAIARQAGIVNPFETEDDRQARLAELRKDYAKCTAYYFGHYATCAPAPCHTRIANKMKRNKHYKGFAKWPRGHAKSVECNITLPFWLWLNGEPMYLVIVGSSEDKAKRLLEDIRAEFEANPKIIADFGEQKSMGDWEDGFFITKGGFIGQAQGLGQSCRGLRVKNLRPTMIVPDDTETRKTIRNERIQDELVEWVETELLPCMDGPCERLVICNNWFAPKMYIKKLAEKHPDWDVDEVFAYDPVTYEPYWKSKYTADYWRKKEQQMGRSSAHAEYLHVAKMIGKIFTEKLIQWGKLPPLNHFTAIVLHWDIAYAGNATSDYNACRIWGLYKNNFWLIDCFVKQTKMRPAVSYIAHKHRTRPSTVAIHLRAESQFWNDEVKRTIREVEQEERIQLPITLVDTPRTKKIERIISGLEALYQNGRVFYNEELKSHADTQEGIQQLLGIEPGYSGNDDAPDADEQAIDYLSKYIVYSDTGSDRMRIGTIESENVI